MCTTVDTSFIFTKRSNVAKCFFDICNAEIGHHFSKSSDFKIKFIEKCILQKMIFNEKKIERLDVF